MLSDLRIIGTCSALLFWAIFRYVESRQWWTLRLRLSCWTPSRALLIFSIATTILTVLDISDYYDVTDLSTRAALGLLVTGTAFLVLRILLPLTESRVYVTVRWKAWTGPSRTGVAPAMTRYLGGREDWQSLTSICRGLSLHPIEAFSHWTSPLVTGIIYDPCELLKSRLRMDEEADEVWVPRSEAKAGAFAPFEPGQSVSLLWGQDLGFIPRCSRGILAVPTSLLNFQPRLKNGVDGRPLCLAHGILARNKGLEPHQLVCNLQTQNSIREFEENSALWPRPSKTLRSFYHDEMSKSFSGLGTSYVIAATELALLIADSDLMTVTDWLDKQLEHQDLYLNNQAAALGASADDLSRLYRGQYAAMLVSLSEHKPGVKIRPEITVFKALCAHEGLRDLPSWMSDPLMIERASEETRTLGSRGLRLVEAAI